MKRLPKNFKFNRVHRGNYMNAPADYTLKSSLPTHYSVGFVCMENGRLTYNQMDSLVKTLKKHLRKKIAMKIHVGFVHPYTSKPLSVRMGKGKGAQRGWYAFVKRGQLLLEVVSIKHKDRWDIELSLKEVREKLPLKMQLRFLTY